MPILRESGAGTEGPQLLPRATLAPHAGAAIECGLFPITLRALYSIGYEYITKDRGNEGPRPPLHNRPLARRAGLHYNLALSMKRDGSRPVLEGKTIAMLFEKPSLRTRVSFEVGM